MGAVYSREMDRISDTRSPQQILVCGKKVPGGGLGGAFRALASFYPDLLMT